MELTHSSTTLTSHLNFLYINFSIFILHNYNPPVDFFFSLSRDCLKFYIWLKLRGARHGGFGLKSC
ncbi:hypothetical protein GIB67_020634 [Kingdonia uniflora]|uniref:Uncharacterized protein n=1 Tax=Kingdonia uniflora TaxID=39325 RepID=A0A7J7M9F0_9MAGN|nr:hypothetical protein GIB67_020634 [Kingdonia uniflora]